jgi:AraC family transcriptional regulator, regulatory protein of adaptative response / methylated-DNA-[protein]-cysteine methyltransferase
MSTNGMTLTADEMYQALLNRDCEYDGLFYFGVRTTGIFCRPTCTAKKPLKRNVQFFDTTTEAMARGFRACRRCRPLEPAGQMPSWLERIVSAAERDLQRRWSDADLRSRGVDPTRVRRWFRRHQGTTFHSYLRSRRLSAAAASLAAGEDATRVAFATGYESVSGFREAFHKWFGIAPGAARDGARLLTINRIPTPLGPMIAAADDAALCLLEFADRRSLPLQLSRLRQRLDCGFAAGAHPLLARTHSELEEYFAGTRRHFTLKIDVPGTEFQQAVWRQLQQIPYGETSTYESVARAIGNPRAVRAVGRANGDNRLAILLPCHRVVRSDGTLSGYAGGVRRKEWLLAHERAIAAATATS